MGTWGAAILSSDEASDIKEEFRDLIAEGIDPGEATERLRKEWNIEPTDQDLWCEFWLALAHTQWHCGRLQPEVKSRALEIIDSGADLKRWDQNTKLAAQRARHLQNLRTQLLSPQPPAKRIKKRYRGTCDWTAGELLAYKLSSGRFAIFRMIGTHTDDGGTSPVCELLNWCGESVPDATQLAQLNVRTECPQFLIGRVTEKQLPATRIVRLGITQAPTQKVGSFFVFLWKSLDDDLKHYFDLE